ncbi:MAG TPA: HAMP domain-containing sensor histidine kinase [Solirubrobacteraceae bacterium]|nr:HAMP domain-containing sensor histidine kinase [Solirubrobacteraceae bacterium]
MTLQRRVLAYLALAAVASCALTVAVAIVLVRHRVAAQRDASLVAQVDFLAASESGLVHGVLVDRVRGGRPARLGPLRSAIVADAVPAGNGLGTITIAGHSLLYASRNTPRGRVILVRSAQLAFAEWRPFLWSVVVAGLGGALLALLLSYVLARRLARPIDQLSAATRRLSAGEDAVAVPVDGEDEIAELGRSFNAMAGQLARSREAQRNFLESVSHELKTPLTAIRGYGEALAEDAVNAPEAGAVIVVESERLSRLVSDLLELARFGRADFIVARVPVDLGAVAAQTVQRHARRARELGVELSAETIPGAAGLGDDQRLLQACSNLVENALRLTPAGGEVRLRAEGRELSVTDTGPGLAADELPHAFERFYLHRRYRSEREVGSGLGLAIVRELVEAMGGTVRATGAPGAGASFTLSLAPTPAPLVTPGVARPSA